MAKTFNLEIVTPERKFFEGAVESLVVNTHHGELGVLPGHIPMLVTIDIGKVQIKRDGEWSHAALTEGFMEIMPDRCIIITDTAEWPDEINVIRASEAKLRAEERLQRHISRIEHIRSQAALARAMQRLKIKGKF